MLSIVALFTPEGPIYIEETMSTVAEEALFFTRFQYKSSVSINLPKKSLYISEPQKNF